MWPNPIEIADLVTITEETLNEKLHFLCSGGIPWWLSLSEKNGLREFVYC